MLAERSTSTVNSGLPGGGGTCSIHVGFSKIASGMANAAAMSPSTVHRPRAGKRPRQAAAYHPHSAAAAKANGTHNASGR